MIKSYERIGSNWRKKNGTTTSLAPIAYSKLLQFLYSNQASSSEQDDIKELVLPKIYWNIVQK